MLSKQADEAYRDSQKEMKQFVKQSDVSAVDDFIKPWVEKRAQFHKYQAMKDIV